MREWRSGCRKVHRRAREGLGPFEAIIVPDSVYGGDGAIFVSENSISGARIVFLQLPRPEICRLSTEAAGAVVAGELAPPSASHSEYFWASWAPEGRRVLWRFFRGIPPGILIRTTAGNGILSFCWMLSGSSGSCLRRLNACLFAPTLCERNLGSDTSAISPRTAYPVRPALPGRRESPTRARPRFVRFAQGPCPCPCVMPSRQILAPDATWWD